MSYQNKTQLSKHSLHSLEMECISIKRMDNCTKEIEWSKQDMHGWGEMIMGENQNQIAEQMCNW